MSRMFYLTQSDASEGAVAESNEDENPILGAEHRRAKPQLSHVPFLESKIPRMFCLTRREALE